MQTSSAGRGAVRYFEDFTVGRLWEYDECYLVTEEEICEVGERWDPQPFHTFQKLCSGLSKP